MIIPTKMDIIYGEGKIYANAESPYISGFQFDYTGDVVFNWNLPDEYLVDSIRGRVVAVNMTPDVECNEILCSYMGALLIDPNSMIFANPNGHRIQVVLTAKSDEINTIRNSSIDGMTKPFDDMDNKLRKRR